MKYVLYVVTGKYSKEIAEKLALLHIDCMDVDFENVLDYIESAMKNNATEVAVSASRYSFSDVYDMKNIARHYGYESFEIKTGDLSFI